jgi:hypothetical protein
MFYVESIYFHYFLCFATDLVFGIPAITCFIWSVYYQIDMTNKYAEIQVLEAASASTATINAEYARLDSLGNDWLN